MRLMPGWETCEWSRGLDSGEGWPEVLGRLLLPGATLSRVLCPALCSLLELWTAPGSDSILTSRQAGHFPDLAPLTNTKR